MVSGYETLCDFELKEMVGVGASGQVWLVRSARDQTRSPYALKVVNKTAIRREKQKIRLQNEKNALLKLDSPFVARLRATFQDSKNVYFLFDFLPGGDLFSHIPTDGLNPDRVLFSASEILLSLAYIHSLGLLYRDLKPENVLFDAGGHAVLTDFGLAKETERSFTLCGTPDYISPEAILRKGHGRKADWWAFGVILYEMTTGETPFTAESVLMVYENVLNATVVYPPEFPEEEKELVSLLLAKDEAQRLVTSAKDVQSHRYFVSVDWEKLRRREATPPWVPKLRSSCDSRYFPSYEIPAVDNIADGELQEF